MLNWKFKQLLLKFALGLMALFILVNTAKLFVPKPVDVELVKVFYEEQVSEKVKFIISEELVLSKLQSKSEIVSMQQKLSDTFTQVEDRLIGERHTELSVKGTYLMGMETKNIKIVHIDNETATIHIKLPKPKLISLDIPYDQVTFDKTKGWASLSMNEEEKKNFYKSVRHSIENELLSSEDVLRTADLYNQEAVRDIIKLLPVIKNVVFE